MCPACGYATGAGAGEGGGMRGAARRAEAPRSRQAATPTVFGGNHRWPTTAELSGQSQFTGAYRFFSAVRSRP